MSDHQLPAVPNFPELEQQWLNRWKKEGIFNAYLTKNSKAKKRFSFIDGPITANNPMGVHHGWGRTYKDLWQKFHNLLGHKLRFQNGFDCQGLWVEVEVEKELKIRNKKDIENLIPGDRFASIDRFVTLCKERVIKFSGVQTQQSQRLGYFMDWDHSYFTMDPENNYMIWQFLSVCHHKKWLYKGHESVPWCPRCETAISQHEMLTEDYKEIVHDSIYLELPLMGRKREYLLVWTTTPWTIPANIAVAVNEKLEYALVEGTTGDRYWVAKDSIASVFGNDTPKTIKTSFGTELVGLRYTGAFDQLEAVAKGALANPEKFHTVIATDELIMPISTTEGTGLVHTAVSAGTEDFKLGKKYGLPMIPIIADNADYLSHLGELSGKNAKKHPEIIFDYLKELETKGENWIFAIVPYKHRYPACWRCKTELVWKIADEWYIAMDRPDATDEKKRTFRQQMIDVAKSIIWMPSFGLERELDWLNNMHDWLISKKNRYWGLALPIYECAHCKTFEVVSSEHDLEKRAVSGFDRFKGHTPHKPWIDEVKIACSSCSCPLSRIDDVGNPWLDAGIVPYSTLSYRHDKKYWKNWFPADFITESFPGQFKNWFYAMIAMSTALERTAPFKRVLGYATLMDEKGKPMHKSSGNMIEFNEAANKIGVDVMRWIYVTQDPKKNALFGYHKAGETQRAFHLPLWNILKFYHTYTKLDHQAKLAQSAKLSLLDQWLLSYWAVTLEKVYRSLSQFKPDMASLALQDFVTTWSNWYIRLSRQRVWTNSDNQADKHALYTTLHSVLSDFCVALSPFLPFYSEELNSHISPTFKSVHLKSWPEMSKQWRNTQLNADMELVKTLAELGHSVRKEQGIKVRQVLSGITYALPGDHTFALPKNEDEYKRLLEAELNIKDITFQYDTAAAKASAQLDTTMTPELEQEGKLRDIIRQIQQKRKEMGCELTEWVAVTLPSGFKPNAKAIGHRVLAKNISFHDTDAVEVTRIT